MASAFIEVPPDYKIYQPGTYNFSLKAGEKTDHWIMFPVGRKNYLNLSSSDHKYQYLDYNGEKYNCWEIDSLPHRTRLKFKLKAVTDQPKIKMIVK